MKKLKQYWWKLLVVILAIFTVPVIVILVRNKFADIQNNDWLVFLGSYLAFFGTVFVSLVTLNQNIIFREEQKQRDDIKRYRDIGAIFSVKQNVNFSFGDGLDVGTIEITNAGSFPIMDVIVNDKYMTQMLKPDESIRIPAKDIKVGNQIFIDYTDADSNTRNQSFILRIFDGTPFFFYEGEIPV